MPIIASTLNMGDNAITNSKTGNDWVNVIGYGADPTGTSDSSAAINSAFAALPAAGGTIYIPQGTYKITSGISMVLGNNQTVVLRGAGSQATILSYHGSGDCVRMYNNLAFGSGGGTSYFSGIHGMTIDGTSGTSSPTGLHAGDITFFQTSDLIIQNFTGTTSKGVHLDNTVTWTEEGDFRLAVSNCTQGVVLDMTTGFNSYGYSNFDLTFFQSAAQSCFCVVNGSLLYHSFIKIRGDINGSATSLTGNPAIVYLSGVGPGGSQNVGSAPTIGSSNFDIVVEPNNGGGTLTHFMQTFYLDATSFGNISECYGILDFSQGTGSFTPITAGALVAASGYFSFSGIMVGDSNLNPSGSVSWMSIGTAEVLNYVPSNTTFDGFFPTQWADVFYTVLDGSSSTVFLNYSGVGNGNTLAAPQRKLMFIQQPSSGGPYTLTWPSSGSPTTTSPTIIWAGGSAPTLQTAANAVDVIELTTFNGATWYGHSFLASGGSFTGGTLTSYLAPSVTALTDGSSVSINAALGNVFTWALGGSSHTLGAPSNPVNGQQIVIDIAYSGTFIPLFNAAFVFGADGQPAWTATNGVTDTVAFRYSSAKSAWLCQGWKLGF